MHARAHGIPTTPLTSDTSTALLSTILSAKQAANDHVKVKQELAQGSRCAAAKGTSQESQEPMEDYSLPSSSNPSPRSTNMDDEMTD